jgi:hypothetical protein
MDDNNDPILREMDVFISQELASSLHLLQFPTRSLDNPPGPPSHVRYRPENKMMELDYAVDAYSESYDRDADSDLQQKHLTYTSTMVTLVFISLSLLEIFVVDSSADTVHGWCVPWRATAPQSFEVSSPDAAHFP